MGFPYYITMLKHAGEFRLFSGYGAASEVRTPDAGTVSIYERTKAGQAELFYKNDANTERDLSLVSLLTGGPYTTGGVLLGKSDGTITQDATKLFWDISNHRLGIGNAAPTVPLDVTGAIAGSTSITGATLVGTTSITDNGLTIGSIVFAGASGLLSQDNTGLFFDNANNFIGLGTTTPSNVIDIVSGTTGRGLDIHNYVSGASSNPIIHFFGSRGTIASPAVTESGDILLNLSAFGRQSASAFSASPKAYIAVFASETWNTTNQGTLIGFATTHTGTTTRAEAGRFTPLGGLNVGDTTDITAGVISVLTGYRIGNAAASGNVLRGDGTNFVSAQLAITDLATFSSANLASRLTDETGTGLAVFNDTPTILTPTIASFTNATHAHTNAAGGGTLSHNSATDNPSSGTHGVTGSVVGTSDSQTLTNKKQGVVGTSAFARMLGITSHTAAPAGTLASDEWDIALYDDGTNPMLRIRFNDAGTEKHVDLGPLTV